MKPGVSSPQKVRECFITRRKEEGEGDDGEREGRPSERQGGD